MALGCRDAFVALGAIAFDGVVDFYRRLLAQEPHPYRPGIYAEFRLDGLRLGIFYPHSENSQEFAHSAQSGLSVCLEVVDLEAAIAHVQSLGYPMGDHRTVASHGREIYLYDPAGNRLILHESSPKKLN
jgi:predicted enzyme related to lactoylglutathione lyase